VTVDPLAEWDFDLPDDRIARFPADRRSSSRLMRVPLAGGEPVDHVFHELPGLLRPGDRVVVNDARVMAARLSARRASGGAVELLVVDPRGDEARAMARPARRLKVGDVLDVDGGGRVTITARHDDGLVSFRPDRPLERLLDECGAMPLPPYLGRDATDADRERYQTVYAGPLGASAAPTAGLHFDDGVVAALAARGIGFSRVTLFVGLGTFRPLRDEDLQRGALFSERYVVGEDVARDLAATRAAGGRVVAVGTTTVRTLESATPPGATAPEPGSGETTLFLRPPRRLAAVDALVTNFHLPRSSLLMLVACLAGRERLLAAYQAAIARGYRFYSYGDAMLLV
jgi:S-adenosylmethionine:tRNA ribosyltransferase-isomerase